MGQLPFWLALFEHMGPSTKMSGLRTNRELTGFSRPEVERLLLWNPQCFAIDYSLYRDSCVSR